MKDQIRMFSADEPDINERNTYRLLLPIFQSVLDECNIDYKELSFDRKKNYSSIMLTSLLIARLCFRGENSYAEIPTYCDEVIPALLSRQKAKDSNFIRVFIPPASSAPDYSDFWASVLSLAVDRIPNEFDCCSQYVECSNAGRCISSQKELALGCGYKKILRSGRVFYGQSRNVD